MSFLRRFSANKTPATYTGVVQPFFEPLIRLSGEKPVDFTVLPQYVQTPEGITVHLQVPSFGCIFISPLSPGHARTGQPREDTIAVGSVQIFVPSGVGSRRLKGIHVKLKGEVMLNMGKGRMGERDVFFERVVEYLDHTEEPLVIREGMQR